MMKTKHMDKLITGPSRWLCLFPWPADWLMMWVLAGDLLMGHCLITQCSCRHHYLHPMITVSVSRHLILSHQQDLTHIHDTLSSLRTLVSPSLISWYSFCHQQCVFRRRRCLSFSFKVLYLNHIWSVLSLSLCAAAKNWELFIIMRQSAARTSFYSSADYKYCLHHGTVQQRSSNMLALARIWWFHIYRSIGLINTQINAAGAWYVAREGCLQACMCVREKRTNWGRKEGWLTQQCYVICLSFLLLFLHFVNCNKREIFA